MPNLRRKKRSGSMPFLEKSKSRNSQYSFNKLETNSSKLLAIKKDVNEPDLSKNKILEPIVIINRKETKVLPYAIKNKKSKYKVTKQKQSQAAISKSFVDKDVAASSSNIDLMMTSDMRLIEEHNDRNVIKYFDHVPSCVQCYFAPYVNVSQKTLNECIPVQKVNKKVSAMETQYCLAQYNNKKPSLTRMLEVARKVSKQQDMQIQQGCNGNTSDDSIDGMCRICHGGQALSKELGPLVSACHCRGTVGRVHVKCLERWLTESGKTKCEICGTSFAVQKIHKFGIPLSLFMWLFSHNAKQLLVDSFGIMLMSPIAVLAALLSGKSLATLMTKEVQVLSWPLASTFVLACMTLVCYYCWIVSAATRHALDWWLWYRSQYDVKLLITDSDDDDG